MVESLETAVGDCHPDDGSHIVPGGNRQRPFGQNLRKLQEQWIVPELGAVSGGGKKPVPIRQGQRHRFSEGQDGLALRIANALLEARDRARVESGTLGQVRLGPAALFAQSFEQPGEDEIPSETALVITDLPWLRSRDLTLHQIGVTQHLVFHARPRIGFRQRISRSKDTGYRDRCVTDCVKSRALFASGRHGTSHYTKNHWFRVVSEVPG